MIDRAVRWAARMFVVVLAGCGGTQAEVRRPEPPPRVEPVAEAPKGPSAFERRWSAACTEGGAVGQCPAPFERPALFIDVDQSDYVAPSFCGALEPAESTAARDALRKKRKALKACFRGAEPGSFVELGPDATPITNPAHLGTARIDACVAKIVKPVLAKLEGARPERTVVLLSTSAKPGDQVLSKESLDSVVNAKAEEVSACYDAALEVWPGLKGRVATSFVIWFDGQVALARTGDSTIDNPMLECCINTAVRSWTFPKPKDGSIALVTFPFTLGGARP